MSDKFKNILAFSFFIIALLSVYFFKDNSLPLRIFFFFIMSFCSLFLLSLTNLYRKLLSFFSVSYDELKKVIWPGRKETIHMTIVVFVFSFLVGFFIWIFDKIITFIIYGFLLGWK